MANIRFMRKIVTITVCVVIAAIISCSQEKHDFAAANAAKEYYDMLIDGKFDGFVDGMNYANPIPDSYREQLEMNARMFVNELNEDRKGLREVRVINCVTDSVLPAANAYLMLCFGDSTFEQVVVPIVKRDGRWWMK